MYAAQPGPGAARARRARPPLDRRARHPRVATSTSTLLGRSGTHVCMCPTTERDLADGIGPARAMYDAGSPITLGSDSHAVIDLFEEARAVELNERLATERRGHWTRRRAAAAATVAGHASLGFPDAGMLVPGAWADLVSVRLDSVRTAGATRRGGRGGGLRRDGGRRALVVVGRPPVVADGRHVLGDVGAMLRRRRSRTDLDDHGAVRAGSVCSTPGPGARGDRGRGAVVDGRRGGVDGPVGDGRPTPTSGWTSRAGCVIPGFVDSHAHLVFAGDRTAEFTARMSGVPYTGGGIRTTVAATRQATDAELAGRRRRPGRGDARPGDHHRGDQERLRADRRGRAALTGDRRRLHRRDHLSRRARGAARALRRRLRAVVDRADARGLRAVRQVGGRVLRARGVRRRPDQGDPGRRDRGGAAARVHAGQLGEGPGVRSRASWARPPPTTAPT